MANLPTAMDAEQVAEAVLLYVEHEWSTLEIADYFALNKSAVGRALVRAGVALRPSYTPAPPLRVKQCTACLHFLPASLFGFRSGTRFKHSQCYSCMNQPTQAPWQTNPAPLTQALSTWRN